MSDLFTDKLKLDDTKKHLIFRPAYAPVDKREGLVRIWDYGPNYGSFKEMAAQRREIIPERICAGLDSAPGLQFANRGLGVANVLTYQGKDFLIAVLKNNALQLINGYFGNGIGAPAEREEVPADINVADNILRTSAIEVLEECNVVRNGKILRGNVQIVKGSKPVSFAPFENQGFPYSNDIAYEAFPLGEKLNCLTNLSPFAVAKASSADDKNPSPLGENVGIYFDSFHNCYKFFSFVRTRLDDIDEFFHTEDKYRDEKGMDTFLHRDGIVLVRLNDKGKMLPEVNRIKEGKLEQISSDSLNVAESLVPSDTRTGTVAAPLLPFLQVAEAR